jgi:polar amino acid transport system substrate-binding protein
MMKKSITKHCVLSLLFSMSILVFLSSLLFSQESSSLQSSVFRDSLLAIKERKKIIVGLSPEYPPFEFKNEAGEIIGFDVDIAKKIAEKLGVSLEIKEYKWEELIPALKRKEIDIIISGMTRTLERAVVVNFSEPYYQTGQSVLLSAKRKDLDFEDLNKPSINIGVVKETTGEEAAKRKLKNATIKTFPGETELTAALLKNEIDGIVMDTPYVEELSKKNPNLKLLPEQLTFELYCFAVDDTDFHFLIWLNHFISEIKLSGEYDEMYNYWFIEKPWKK